MVSANKGLKVDECKCTEIDKLALEILQDPNAVFRFDGSDLMPAAVGSNAFWKQVDQLDHRAEHPADAGQHRGGLAEVDG